MYIPENTMLKYCEGMLPSPPSLSGWYGLFSSGSSTISCLRNVWFAKININTYHIRYDRLCECNFIILYSNASRWLLFFIYLFTNLSIANLDRRIGNIFSGDTFKYAYFLLSSLDKQSMFFFGVVTTDEATPVKYLLRLVSRV